MGFVLLILLGGVESYKYCSLAYTFGLVNGNKNNGMLPAYGKLHFACHISIVFELNVGVKIK